MRTALRPVHYANLRRSIGGDPANAAQSIAAYQVELRKRSWLPVTQISSFEASRGLYIKQCRCCSSNSPQRAPRVQTPCHPFSLCTALSQLVSRMRSRRRCSAALCPLHTAPTRALGSLGVARAVGPSNSPASKVPCHLPWHLIALFVRAVLHVSPLWIPCTCDTHVQALLSPVILSNAALLLPLYHSECRHISKSPAIPRTILCRKLTGTRVTATILLAAANYVLYHV